MLLMAIYIGRTQSYMHHLLSVNVPPSFIYRQKQSHLRTAFIFSKCSPINHQEFFQHFLLTARFYSRITVYTKIQCQSTAHSWIIPKSFQSIRKNANMGFGPQSRYPLHNLIVVTNLHKYKTASCCK
jgi:hypothetical protein